MFRREGEDERRKWNLRQEVESEEGVLCLHGALTDISIRKGADNRF